MISDAINRLQEQVNNDPELMRRGKYFSTKFALRIDNTWTMFVIDDGKLVEVLVEVRESPKGTDFIIKADAETWALFNEANPKPGYQDLTALVETRRARVSGDVIPWLSNMMYIKGVINKFVSCEL